MSTDYPNAKKLNNPDPDKPIKKTNNQQTLFVINGIEKAPNPNKYPTTCSILSLKEKEMVESYNELSKRDRRVSVRDTMRHMATITQWELVLEENGVEKAREITIIRKQKGYLTCTIGYIVPPQN